ncbi:MAG: alpha-L-rhamnosidase N-terminal domain-containing protein [Mangrovibacterium sp.]
MNVLKRIQVLTTVFLFGVSGYAAKSGITVSKMTCEYRENPLGISSQHPRLGWQLEAPGRNVSQSAYRVLVSESVEQLNRDKGEVWDSKKIKSGQSALIPYAEETLRSGKQYFWKVRVWDNKGNASVWSEVNTWTMGLPETGDWQARWAGAGGTKDSLNPYAALQFRKEVILGKKPVKAVARFCGLGFGELYINGEKVSGDKMVPGWTDYRKKVYYMTYDVTGQIRQGQNAIGVLLGNGWYHLPTPDLFGYEKAPWKSDPEFLLNMTVTYEDGSETVIGSDDTWKWRISPITFNCIRGGGNG